MVSVAGASVAGASVVGASVAGASVEGDSALDDAPMVALSSKAALSDSGSASTQLAFSANVVSGVSPTLLSCPGNIHVGYASTPAALHASGSAFSPLGSHSMYVAYWKSLPNFFFCAAQ